MSNRETDINLTREVANRINDETAAKFGQMTAEEARKRVAHVYDRARIVDRLHVELPPEVHGEWVSRDAVAIHAKEMLGFEIDTQYAINRKLNDVGTGEAVVGDVVFMICPKVLKEAIDEEAARRYAATHLRTRQVEEREFESNTKSAKLDTVIESQAHRIDGVELEQTLRSHNRG